MLLRNTRLLPAPGPRAHLHPAQRARAPAFRRARPALARLLPALCLRWPPARLSYAGPAGPAAARTRVSCRFPACASPAGQARACRLLPARANRAMLRRKPSELFMQLSHAPAEQSLASISSYSSYSDSEATTEAGGED